MKFGDVLRQLLSILAVIPNSASEGKIGGLNLVLKDGDHMIQERTNQTTRVINNLKWTLVDFSAQCPLSLWELPLPYHP